MDPGADGGGSGGDDPGTGDTDWTDPGTGVGGMGGGLFDPGPPSGGSAGDDGKGGSGGQEHFVQDETVAEPLTILGLLGVFSSLGAYLRRRRERKP